MLSTKFDKDGINYFADFFDEFEEHVEKVAKAITGMNVTIDMDDQCFLRRQISWITYWRGELDDKGTIEVSDEDFASMDYEATREKHEKLREEKKQREKEAVEAKKAKAKIEYEAKEEELKAKIIEREKVKLKYLMKKYPELIK